MRITAKILEILKSLVISYIFTSIALVLFAFLIYKYELSEEIINILIIATYIISTLLGGFIIGKRIKNRKFVWGIFVGIMYIVILSIASIIMNKGINFFATENITISIMCIAGGMLGGMLS